MLAHPKNSFPSCVGSAGLFTPSVISSVFVGELSSNLPPFASNVTNFSSDQIAYTTWCVVTAVSDVNFLSADNALNFSAVTIVLPSSVLPSSVTQPKKVLPSAVGALTNSSPVSALTFAPVNPFGAYPSSPKNLTLSGTTFTDCFVPLSKAPSVASNNTLVLTLTSSQSDGSDDPSDALIINLMSLTKVKDPSGLTTPAFLSSFNS